MTDLLLRGGKGGSSSFKQTPDNLRSNDTFEGVMGVGIGPMRGPTNGLKSITLDGTAIENATGELNFGDFVCNIGDGDPTKFPQTVQLKLGAGAAPTNVGLSLTNTTGSNPVWVTKTLNNTNADFIDLRFIVNQLFTQDKKGIYSGTATLRIQMKPVGSTNWIEPNVGTPSGVYQPRGLSIGFLKVLIPESYYDDNGYWPTTSYSPGYQITGKTTSPAVYELRIAVPNDGGYANKGWDIRVQLAERETYDADPNFEKRQITWESMAAVYGNTMGTHEDWRGLCWMQLFGKASDQLTGVPEIGGEWDTKIVSVPASVFEPEGRTYNTITWDGSWAKAWTNDPAWVINDAISDGLSGLSLIAPGSYLNKWDALEASKWASERVPDGNGGTEPRYSLNLAVTQPQKAEEFIRYLAGAVGGMAWDQGDGQWRMKMDKPDVPVDIFTLDNIEGEFIYSHTDVDTRYNDITVAFKNKEMAYREDRVRIYDNASIALIGHKPTTIVGVGCTGRQEALRRAMLRLQSTVGETRIVNFTTNRRGRNVEHLDLILVADGDLGAQEKQTNGRTIAVSGDRKTITLRDPVWLDVGVAYTLRFASPNAAYNPDTATQPTDPNWKKPTLTQTRNVTNGASARGSVTTITLDTALPADIADNLAIALEATNLPTIPRLFRVTNVVKNDDGERISISALQVNTAKWNLADNVTNQATVFQDLRGAVPAPLPPVAGPVLSLLRVAATQGSNVNLVGNWIRPPGAFVSGFRVQTSINGGALETRTENTQFTTFELVNPVPGIYQIEICTVDRRGGYSEPLRGSLEVTQALIDATQIIYPSTGETVASLKPQEVGANVTETRKAADAGAVQGRPATQVLDQIDTTKAAMSDATGKLYSLKDIVGDVADLHNTYGNTQTSQAAATAAQAARDAAQAAQTAAGNSASGAAASATTAATARDNAQQALTDANAASTAAKTARDAAATAKTAAETARDTAVQAKTDSQTAVTAAQGARDTAITNANAASTSATNASGFASTASGAATTATQQATAAGQSASTASAQATIATTQAGQATTSATNAATSESNALGSKNAAATSAGVSATSAAQSLQTAASLLPSTFGQGSLFWRRNWDGAPTRTEVPTLENNQWSFADGTAVFDSTNGGGSIDISNLGAVPLVAGRRLRLTAVWQVVNGSNQTALLATLFFIGMTPGYASFNTPGAQTAINQGSTGWGTANGFATSVFEIDSNTIITGYANPGFVRGLMRLSVPGGTPAAIVVRIKSLTFEDVTSVVASAASASAASTSASNAATSATNAGTSASAAQTSATTASTQAGNASTSATNAATSATNAQGSANSAATSATTAASSYQSTLKSSGDQHFDNGLDGYADPGLSGGGSLANATTAVVDTGRSNVVISKPGTALGFVSKKRYPVTTTAQKFEISASYRKVSGSATSNLYIGYLMYDASGAIINGSGYGNYPLVKNAGATDAVWHDVSTIIGKADVLGDALIAPSAVAISPVAFMNFNGVSTDVSWAIDYLTLRDTTQEFNAGASANAAATSASAASASQTAAGQSATSAAGSATTATTQAGNAQTYANNASTSATNASGSANTATTQAGVATQAKTDAQTAAGAASTSASNASASATTAGQQATAAGQSATTASTKAGEASTSASNAATSATNASGSANSASTQAGVATQAKTDAQTAATAASNSASTASTQATNAGTSASTAQTAAQTASTKAGEASTSATNAATSATNASGSANTATSSAGVAASSRDGAVLAAARTLPSDFQQDGLFWMYGYAGTPANQPITNQNWSFATVSGEGRVAQQPAGIGGGGDVSTYGSLPFSATRRYRFTTRAAVTGGTANLDMFPIGLAADGITYTGNPSQLSTALTSTFTDYTMEFSGAMPQQGGAGPAVLIRVLARFYNKSSGALLQVSKIKIEDITSEAASAASAAAAATSASAASTSATNAGTSATSAQTSATNASTSAGNAQTYANNASTSATNAAGSANTASTQAGVATTQAGNAAGSATAASGSANSAGTSATNAGNSATAAAGSASTASTAAGNASTSASNAATSATNAQGYSNSAATAQSATATTYQNALLITGNQSFDNGTDGYEIVAYGALSEASFLSSGYGRGTQIVTTAGRQFGLASKKRYPISSAAQKWEIAASARLVGGTARNDFYIGYLVYDAAGNRFNAVDGFGNYPLFKAYQFANNEWVDSKAYIGKSDMTGSSIIPANAVSFSPAIFVNDQGNSGNAFYAIDYLTVRDATDEWNAKGSASAAATSASNAAASQSAAGTSASAASTSATNASTSAGSASTSASAAATSATNAAGSANAASTSSTLSATASAAAVQASAQQLPGGFDQGNTFWRASWQGAPSRPQDLSTNQWTFSNGCAYLTTANGGNLDLAQLSAMPVRAGRKYRLTATWLTQYAAGTNSVNATLFFIGLNSSFGYLNTPGAGIYINQGEVGWGEPNGLRTHTFTINTADLGANAAFVRGLIRVNSTATGQTFRVQSLVLEDVTAEQAVTDVTARVSTVEGVAASAADRVATAYSVKEVVAGGASAFLSFRAKDDNGNFTSDVAIGASTISLYNAAAGGGWRLAMQMAGGNAVFTGGLQAGAFIRLGSGAGWPVALAQRDFLVADDQYIDFGTNLYNVPDFSFVRNNLAVLNSGETYQLYIDGPTATGGTLRAKISTPAAPSAVNLTSDGAPGSGPTRQMEKGGNADASDGNYTIQMYGYVTGYAYYVNTGGNQCVWTEAYLHDGTFMGDAKVGHEVMTLEGYDTLAVDVIRSTRIVDQLCIRITTASGCTLTASVSTPIVDRDGETRRISETLRTQVAVRDHGDFRWEEIVDVQPVGMKPVAFMSCGDKVFAAGDQEDRMIFTHNLKAQQPEQ